jgi:hypothetical protein
VFLSKISHVQRTEDETNLLLKKTGFPYAFCWQDVAFENNTVMPYVRGGPTLSAECIFAAGLAVGQELKSHGT